MIVRAAPLLTVLSLLATPALAQESAEEAPPPADSPAPADEDPADAAPPPAEPEAEAEDPVAAPAAAPLPAPPPVILQPAPPSPFSPDQRNGWLAQCRSTFLRAGAALGGPNGLPDACETQLLDFERSYVPTADGQPPVIWVRMPIARQAVAPTSTENPEE